MAIARPTKREIKRIANQRKEIELAFVEIVTFLYAQGIFILKNEDKMHVFC